MAAYTTIDNPELYFQTKIYTGDGNSGRALTLPGDTDMAPNLVWVKQRNTTRNQILANSVSGTSKNLYPDLPDAEDTTGGPITAFGSDGFTVSDSANANEDSGTYVAWCWNESATAGFDIVSYTGNGSARTISHSTGGTNPLGLIICKSRGTNDNWATYHSSLGGDFNMTLDSNEAKLDTNTPWNDTDATASVFSVLSSGRTNANTQTYMAFCFAPVQGYSKFGTYTGNGNADGTFVYTGFRPAWIMIKNSGATASWVMYDNKRYTYNKGGTAATGLRADTNAAEDASEDGISFLSNGFKLMATGTPTNSSGGTYVYMAFAEQPFVNSNGVPCNAR